MTLLTLKTNVFGTLAIAIASSAGTVLFSQWLSQTPSSAVQATVPPVQMSVAGHASAEDIMACGQNVYSPVQRRCVDQQTFDIEMQRLFTALGLDSAIYASDVPPSLLDK